MGFVLFEDVDGMEVYVNPERVMWVREYPGNTTVINCGSEDRIAGRLTPAAQAVAALGLRCGRGGGMGCGGARFGFLSLWF